MLAPQPPSPALSSGAPKQAAYPPRSSADSSGGMQQAATAVPATAAALAAPASPAAPTAVATSAPAPLPAAPASPAAAAAPAAPGASPGARRLPPAGPSANGNAGSPAQSRIAAAAAASNLTLGLPGSGGSGGGSPWLARQFSGMDLSSCGGSPAARRCPFVIGVAGGTASGKTTVCDRIIQRLHDQCVVMLNQDAFYRSLTQEELADVQNYNFDHPNAFDTPSLLECLAQLRRGMACEVPTYDFTTHTRAKETRRVEPADVIIVEGILVLHIEEVRAQLNMKVYVDTDDDVRLARRIQRDVTHRGRDVAGVIEQYTRFVKPSFDQYVGPSRRFADVIIPWQRGDNIVAIDLITEHIRLKLKTHDLLRIYPNLEVIPSNFQIRGMHTIVRDATTSKNDFVFYADRLNRLVVEAGLGHLPFTEKTVVTPTGQLYVGVDFTRGICGVSVIRSGEAMENALRECCQGIKIGKILVHRHGSGEEVVYERLPTDIASRYVLLLDPVSGTGNTASRAIRVLLERGVAEDKILFLCLIAAPDAIHKVCTSFPAVKVICSEIDQCLDSDWRVAPGVGEFGDRYFCE